MPISIIIPTYNGAKRIGKCLEALAQQDYQNDYEILVVDDGSKDNTAALIEEKYPQVKLMRQENAGPAAARNNGAQHASGDIILFTDDDCIPVTDWLLQMLKPFENPAVVAVKGAYLTKQPQLIARFVQLEYEDKYRLLEKESYIDFIDTYSAAFRQEVFIKYGGYDSSFPVACAEDVELSYRMSYAGEKMVFQPKAQVYHTHPDTLMNYLKKKYKFAYWRVLAVKKNPQKAVKDSHTPQLMKIQLLFIPVLILLLLGGLLEPWLFSIAGALLGLFFITTLPFAKRSLRKDKKVGMVSPLLLLGRAIAQFFGVFSGSVNLLFTKS